MRLLPSLITSSVGLLVLILLEKYATSKRCTDISLSSFLREYGPAYLLSTFLLSLLLTGRESSSGTFTEVVIPPAKNV